MISYIAGVLKYKNEDFIIVENGGIGFKIYAAKETISSLPTVENNVKLYTYMNVREDDLSLFGFLSMEQLEMFNRLITVKGVGPKAAMALLASLTPSQISLAIITDDVKTLSIGQGVGKKTAQQIILDLKGKIDTMSASGATIENAIQTSATAQNPYKAEAVEALLSLGFAKPEVVKAVDAVWNDDLTAAEIISRALKVL